MSIMPQVDFYELNKANILANWQTLPYEKFKLFLRLNNDQYGFAALKVEEAILGIGQSGKLKRRLKVAIECDDIETICRCIASCHRSALRNFFQKKSKMCVKFLKDYYAEHNNL